jgi:putative membrane protein
MITDHQNANRMLEEGGYAVVPNPVVEVLNTDVTRRMARLRALSGADFDRAYMTDQVELHRVALDTIKSTLLPSAQNARLEQTLTTMRDSVQTHLTHATTLQTSLGGATMP